MNKILSILLALFLAACSSERGKTPGTDEQKQVKKIYTCPMHPEIVKNEPGRCPICGMDLVEKSSGTAGADTSLSMLLRPTYAFVVSDIKTIKVTEREVPVQLITSGVISYDTRRLRSVAARVSGRVEALYVKYKYQRVREGDKVMELYSEELQTGQQNYLMLLKQDAQNTAMITAAEKQLLLLGLAPEQIAQIKETRSALKTVAVYSPYSGHLHDAEVAITENEMDGPLQSMQPLRLREGMYVEKGQTVFAIYATDEVWVRLSFFPDQQARIEKGQEIRLKVDGVADSLNGRLDFIEPVLNGSAQGVIGRVYLKNTDAALKVGAAVTGRLLARTTKGLFVPSSAILSLGFSHVVFVPVGKAFQPKRVNIGRQAEGFTQILSGLQPQEEIAVNAHMLVDSESFVKIPQ